MRIPKKYFHDTFILLLLSFSVVLVVVGGALIMLRSGIGQNVDGYIISYRDNLGLSAYERGGIVPILTFIPFALVNFATVVLLSLRTYAIRRTLAIAILSLGMLVQILTIIVSNALLTLY